MTTPSQIGKYVEPQLNSYGGFGSVYRSWHPNLRRYVAITVMRPQFAQDAEWVNRFQEESRFMARVDQHPHIVRVTDLQQGEHGLFMVMDSYPRGKL